MGGKGIDPVARGIGMDTIRPTCAVVGNGIGMFQFSGVPEDNGIIVFCITTARGNFKSPE